MSKPEPTASDIARLRQASDWVQCLHESDDPALTEQWLQWCRSDQRNLAAFEQMQHLWDAFPVSAPRPNNKFMAWAASIALAVGLAGWLALHYPHVQVLDTPVGKQRHITLADGSGIDLAPDSRVSARFTLAGREVLLERGQAFFAVAHNTLRPFVVNAGGLTVKAVGTTFDVRTGPSTTVVTVGEGSVNVTPGNDKTFRVGVGQRVEYLKPPHRTQIATVNPNIAGSWRSGTLQFLGEPLEDVVGAVNRYNTAQIEVAPALRQTRFTGTLSPRDMRDWLRALEQIYAVEVVDQGTQGILIQSRGYDVHRR
jgi:transmembrane sensor